MEKYDNDDPSYRRNMEGYMEGSLDIDNFADVVEAIHIVQENMGIAGATAEEVEDGESATPPDEPSREGYIFTGWDKSYENITSDLVIKAQYKSEEEGFEEVIGEGRRVNNKVLHDGQVYIRQGENIYTIHGQVVNNVK